MDFYRSAEAAALLGINPRTLYRWADEGKVPSIALESRHRRYPKAEFDAYVAGLERQKAS